MEYIKKKVVMAGLQPGRTHLGNVLGAIVPAFELAKSTGLPLRFMIADLHRLTTTFKSQADNVEVLCRCIQNLAANFFPTQEFSIYMQSEVKATLHISWILNCLTTTATVEKILAINALEKAANVGILVYPVLVAADILASGASVISVGPDQSMNMEAAKKILKKVKYDFTVKYSDFKVLDLKTLDKMSKSSRSTSGIIYLNAGASESNKIKSAVSDPAGIQNLMTIYTKVASILKLPTNYTAEAATSNAMQFKIELTDYVAKFLNVCNKLVPIEAGLANHDANELGTHQLSALRILINEPTFD